MRRGFARGAWLLVASLCVGLAGCSGSGSEPHGGVPNSPDAAQPLGVGATAPDVSFRNLEGAPVSLASLLAEGPVALVFYRGGW
jgi:hypothetical protein